MSIRATRVVKFIRLGEQGKPGKDGEPGADGKDGYSFTNNMLKGTKSWFGWSMQEGYALNISARADDGLFVVQGQNSSDRSYIDLYQNKVIEFEPDTVYTFSFDLKGSGSIRSFVYPDVTAQIIATHSCVISNATAADTQVKHNLTENWERHYVVFRTRGDVSGLKNVLLRIQDKTSVAQICGVKLEKGDNRDPQWTLHPDEYKGDKGDKGDAGARGAILRGPQDWESLPEGYQFQSGGDGDEFKDFIVYKGEYYSCTANHVKTAVTPVEGSAASPKLWQLSDRVEMVATQILLAKYALVKNLGVERVQTTGESASIDIHDGMIEISGLYCCNIRFGVDENGCAVLSYYDNDGKFLYNLGPEGITKLDRCDSYWEELKLIKTHDSSKTLEEVQRDYKYGTIMYDAYGYSRYYRFHSGYIGSILDDRINDGKVFLSNSVTSGYIPDGWYQLYGTTTVVNNLELVEPGLNTDTGLEVWESSKNRTSVTIMQFVSGNCMSKMSVITKLS